MLSINIVKCQFTPSIRSKTGVGIEPGKRGRGTSLACNNIIITCIMASKELHVVGFPSYLDIVFIVFVLFLAAFMYLYRTVALIDTFLFDFDKRPRLSSLYFKGLCRSVFMKKGKLYDGDSQSNALQIYARKCRVDVSQLGHYKTVCGYQTPCKIPVYYMECFFNHVISTLVTSSKFRLSPFGLIHINDVADQFEDIVVGNYNVSAQVLEYREVDSGAEVDLKVEAFSEDDICVVRSIRTLLSRSRRAGKHGTGQTQQGHTESDGECIEVDVPQRTGVRYAKISGDYSPLHLYRPTAKVMGYKAPIAHGMWTAARSLAELHKRGVIQLGAPLHVEVSLQQPLSIPGTAIMTHSAISDVDKSISFRVENKDSKEAHVVGLVSNEARVTTAS